MVTVLNTHRILSVEDLEALITEEQRNFLNLGDETEDLLDTLELVVLDLLINEKACKVIHAFPGDSASGLFICDEIFLIGECGSPPPQTVEGKQFMVWYLEVTGQQCDYSKFQHLYMKR